MGEEDEREHDASGDRDAAHEWDGAMIECIVMAADLMAEIRVLEALRSAGLAARAAAIGEDWPIAMDGAANQASNSAGPRTIGVVDLTAVGAIEAIERAVIAGVPVVAYGPHVDGDMLAAARRAGATAVYPRGRFLMEAAALVKAVATGGGADSTRRPAGG